MTSFSEHGSYVILNQRNTSFLTVYNMITFGERNIFSYYDVMNLNLMTSQKNGPWEYFDFGENGCPTPYGVEKNKKLRRYSFLILPPCSSDPCYLCLFLKMSAAGYRATSGHSA